MKRPIFQRIADRLLWWACIGAVIGCRAMPSRFRFTSFDLWLAGWAALYSYSVDYADFVETRELNRPRPSPHREG